MKGLETRTLIIERSAELFNTRGYHGCSLADIMEATQLQKGGIYNHFKNKDEIALAAFENSRDKMFKRFRSRLDKDNNPIAKLISIIDVFQSFYHDPVVMGGCPIINTAVDSLGTHPELSQKAKDAVDLLRNYVTIKVDECKNAGLLKDQLGDLDLASMIVSSLEGALIFSRISKDDTQLNATAAFLKQLVRSYQTDPNHVQ